MGLPKKYRKDVNLYPGNVGPERRKDLVDFIADKGTFLPKGVTHEDMDSSMREFVEKQLEITIDGQKVPVVFMSIQRWAEFTKTWTFTDQHKNVKMPFITIVRNPDAQPGTNQSGLWNIPGMPTWGYMKVQTWDGARKGVDTYRIPQPVPVDFTYEVRLFCHKMRDLNKLNAKVIGEFRSRQSYVQPNGHYMPLHLESIGDESQIEDIDARKFYVQLYEIKMLGYLLNEEEFKVIPSINRAIITTEISEDKIKPIVRVSKPDADNTQYVITAIFEPSSITQHAMIIDDYPVTFTQIDLDNVSSVIIKVNGNTVNVPFTTQVGDNLSVIVNRINNTFTSKMVLIGNIV